MMDSSLSTPEAKHSGLSSIEFQRLLPYLLLTLLFCAVVVPRIFNPNINFYGAEDETLFHYPMIQQFRAEFPHIDLVNYSSATTPLYHLLMLVPAALFNSNLIALRVVNALISLICAFVIYLFFAKLADTRTSFVLACVVIASPYFVGPAIRLSTDNLALLWMVLALLTVYSDQSPFFSLLAILTRQFYAWLIGVSVLAQLKQGRIRAALLNLIPLAGLAVFVVLWKGLTPPRFASQVSHSLINLNVLTYVLSLLGLFGIFFLPSFVGKLRKEPLLIAHCVLLMIGGCVFLWLHPMTGGVISGDQGGALWTAAQRFPALHSSSLLYWGLFPLGIAWLYLMFRHQDIVFISVFVFWLAANLVSDSVYQKYYEPFLLFYLGWFLVKARQRYDWVGTAVLAVGLLGLSLYRL